MKGDLVRINDSNGRENSCNWQFRNLEIQLVKDIINVSEKTKMIVPISGNIESNLKVEIECGEAFPIEEEIIFRIKKDNNYLFSISNNIYND